MLAERDTTGKPPGQQQGKQEQEKDTELTQGKPSETRMTRAQLRTHDTPHATRTRTRNTTSRLGGLRED